MEWVPEKSRLALISGGSASFTSRAKVSLDVKAYICPPLDVRRTLTSAPDPTNECLRTPTTDPHFPSKAPSRGTTLRNLRQDQRHPSCRYGCGPWQEEHSTHWDRLDRRAELQGAKVHELGTRDDDFRWSVWDWSSRALIGYGVPHVYGRIGDVPRRAPSHHPCVSSGSGHGRPVTLSPSAAGSGPEQ
jgi:hypothetical protein